MTEKATILLIDDEEPLLEVLGTALTDAGYFCLRSSSAAAALKLLDRTPEIDVIVSDIRMPGMDGIELLKTVRERYLDRRWLQVIFVTGHATLENSVEALRLEATDFLYKPVRRQQLLEAVGKAVEKGEAQRQMLTKLLEGHERLEKLMLEARQLSDVLGSFKGAPGIATEGASTSQDVGTATDEVPGRERLLELLRTRDIKTRYFTDRLFVDPAWHMLLDLMENNLLERNVSVSSLYIASGVASATASRRLEEMEEAGLVERWLDPNDKRRQFVQLTARATELVTSYLVALGQKIPN
ncbi:response regulator [Agrobacterium deltaense]|uniref:response regulator n=1 Tax=Agrobacterium deltaense TaxID=1183412 RepID=UPI003D997000